MFRATESAEPLPSPAAEPHDSDQVLSPPICRRSSLFSPSPVGPRSLSRKRKNLSFASSVEVFAFSPRDSPTAFLKLRQTMRAPEPDSPVVRRLDFGPEAATTTLGTRLLTALFWFGVAVAFLPFLPLRLVYASCMSALGTSFRSKAVIVTHAYSLSGCRPHEPSSYKRSQKPLRERGIEEPQVR